jgi:predicted nucleic acid-binding protein
MRLLIFSFFILTFSTAKKHHLNVRDTFSITMDIEFNKLVESTLNIIETIVQNNMSKEELEDFLMNVSLYLLIVISK